MASKFTGRDYSTLRAEIIEFLRARLPKDWDYNNFADPVVIFAESLARIGDQLHYTIDELRRECDVATAKRASSIYSYAMREGYKMMLPRASFGTISINTTKEQDGLLHLNLHQFDEIKVKPAGESLFVVDEDDVNTDLHAPLDKEYAKQLSNYSSIANKAEQDAARNVYLSYVESVYEKTQHVRVVLGTKDTFSFTYNDISKDSTVELPDPLIDRDLVRLSYHSDNTMENRDEWIPLTYVDDVISSGFQYYSYTLTPKFIGGAITLCIEFPTNYRDIFEHDLSAKFRFEYIKIKNSKIEPLPEYENNADAVDFGGAITIVPGYEEDADIAENGMQYRVSFGDGIKGYAEYESAFTTRDNYKKFVQNYSALLTKDDYSSYIKAMTTSHCDIYDHGDMYKVPSVLPADAELFPRVVYAITDSKYAGRENLWYDLRERSSRSDCIVMIPYGKDPYMIVIKAECYLVGTSIASVATAIQNELLNYYAGDIGEKIPKISMINYLTHKASDKVIRMESLILRDSTYGTIDNTFNSVNQLDNDQVDALYGALQSGNVNYYTPLTDETQTDDAWKYYLQGKLYVWKDEGGEIHVNTADELAKENESRATPVVATERVYNKYPPIIYKYMKEVDRTVTTPPITIPSEDEESPSTEETNSEESSTSKTSDETLYEYRNEVEYQDFPESFPKIYYTKSAEDKEIKNYDELIKHQVVYGEIDSEDWDVDDNKLFSLDVNDYDYVQEDDASFNAYDPYWIMIKYIDPNDPDPTERYGYILSSHTTYDNENPETHIKLKASDDPEHEGQPAFNENLIYTNPLTNTNSAEGTREPIKEYAVISAYDEYENPIYLDVTNLQIDGQSVDVNTDLSELFGAVPYDQPAHINVDAKYKLHHYMVPVLSKVVVLIKSVNTKPTK